jgi:F0F1-type ATP synthase gamma subunit
MGSKIKNVVKVMNFHALIRVDNAKRRAVLYQQMEDEVYHMMDLIMNNRNLILDKNMLKTRSDRPVLTIYLGSDYGFCSNYNSLINHELEQDPDGEKILVGKKLHKVADHVLLRLKQEEFEGRIHEVEDILRESIRRKKHSAIRVVYNRYINSTEMSLESKQIYPFEMKAEADPANYRDDFLIDGDVEELLTELATTYLAYQIRITAFSGYASENIMRQNTTSESLKKIEEREEEALMEERRERRQQEFSRTIESFSKMKIRNGGE